MTSKDFGKNLIVGGIAIAATVGAFAFGNIWGYNLGIKDATPISSNRRDINGDGVEDLVITDSLSRKTVLFGVPRELMTDKADTLTTYVTSDKIKQYINDRRDNMAKDAIILQKEKDDHYLESMSNAEKNVTNSKSGDNN